MTSCRFYIHFAPTHYFKGTSGSAWLVGSLFSSGSFETISNLNADMWHLQDGLMTPNGSITKLLFMYPQINDVVDAKRKAGFPTTITDDAGRLLRLFVPEFQLYSSFLCNSFQFTTSPLNGINQTWSSLADNVDFSMGLSPMPLVTATESLAGNSFGNLVRFSMTDCMSSGNSLPCLFHCEKTAHWRFP